MKLSKGHFSSQQGATLIGPLDAIEEIHTFRIVLPYFPNTFNEELPDRNQKGVAPISLATSGLPTRQRHSIYFHFLCRLSCSALDMCIPPHSCISQASCDKLSFCCSDPLFFSYREQWVQCPDPQGEMRLRVLPWKPCPCFSNQHVRTGNLLNSFTEKTKNNRAHQQLFTARGLTSLRYRVFCAFSSLHAQHVVMLAKFSIDSLIHPITALSDAEVHQNSRTCSHCSYSEFYNTFIIFKLEISCVFTT